MTLPPPEPGFEALHPHARWLMCLSSTIAAALLVGAPLFAAMLLASAHLTFDRMTAAAVLLPLVLFVALGLGIWHGGRAWARTRFRLDAQGLEIHRGVWWRTRTRIPRVRVQHTDIDSGPLDRRLGLATLKVHTAGSRMASIDIGGLPAPRAVELRDALLAGDDDAL